MNNIHNKFITEEKEVFFRINNLWKRLYAPGGVYNRQKSKIFYRTSFEFLSNSTNDRDRIVFVAILRYK